MNKYIVQGRFDHSGALCLIGTFNARNATGAIRQAVEILAHNDEEVFHVIATLETTE